MVVLCWEVTARALARGHWVFFMRVLLTPGICFVHQSERIQCTRCLNELHYKGVELVKGLIYGLYRISFIGMLCQVVCLLPRLWYFLKFYKSFIG